MASERERSKQTNPNKHIPKDAQVIMSILKELGITDYEPRVINQLLEFTYRKCASKQSDSFISTRLHWFVFVYFAVLCVIRIRHLHSGRCQSVHKSCEKESHRPGRCQIGLSNGFGQSVHCTTTQRCMYDQRTQESSASIYSICFCLHSQVLLELARGRNIAPLPLIKPHCGLRLPPDRYCLVAANYKLRAAAQNKKMTKSAIEGRSTIKTQIKSTPTSTIKRPVVNAAKSQTVTIPKPVFKFSTTAKTVPAKVRTDVKMEIDDPMMMEDGSSKRKREDDDWLVDRWGGMNECNMKWK